MRFEALEHGAAEAGLLIMGALHSGDGDAGTVVLLGTGPGFWPVFSQSPEYEDGRPDPVDRWSKRVVGALAKGAEGNCQFPSDGPPYPPFIAWALGTGRAFQSPTGMLVHDTVGLMISYRGAILFEDRLALPHAVGASPCDSCRDRPCVTACPVGALSDTAAYDVPACHAFLDSRAGQDCMARGCAARRACPVSAGAGRDPTQSALHMKAFHPA